MTINHRIQRYLLRLRSFQFELLFIWCFCSMLIVHTDSRKFYFFIWKYTFFGGLCTERAYGVMHKNGNIFCSASKLTVNVRNWCHLLVILSCTWHAEREREKEKHVVFAITDLWPANSACVNINCLQHFLLLRMQYASINTRLIVYYPYLSIL